MNSDVFVTADELYEITRGKQTRLTDNISLYDINDKINFLGSEKIEIEGLQKYNDIDYYRHITFKIEKKSGYFFYKNLSTNIPKNLIDTILITIGGQRSETVYYNLYEYLQHKYYPNSLSSDLVPSTLFHFGIPALYYHDIDIKIILKPHKLENPKIFIDMYEVTSKTSDRLEYNNFDITSVTFQSIIHECLSYYVEHLYLHDDTNFNKNLSYFNHPCKYIIIKSKMDPFLLQELELLCIPDSQKFKEYIHKVKLLYSISDIYVYKLDRYVNLSRLDKFIIKKDANIIDLYKVDNFDVYVCNINDLSLISGMSNASWS